MALIREEQANDTQNGYLSSTPYQPKDPRQNKRRSVAMKFLKKYFWEGQKLDVEVKTSEVNMPFWKRVIRSRLFWGITIPLIFFEVCWWLLAVKHDYFQYFPEKYVMSITMIFGAMIAGMTSEGGGAVAFPVMTLALHISPTVARDFSLMIQACGMSAAAFTIFWMKLKVEVHSLLFCSIGNIIKIRN